MSGERMRGVNRWSTLLAAHGSGRAGAYGICSHCCTACRIDRPAPTRRSRSGDPWRVRRCETPGMALHHREVVRDELANSVYPGQDLGKAIPKYAFPARETAPNDAFQVVRDEL